MEQYVAFKNELEELVEECIRTPESCKNSSSMEAVLNGKASSELRRLVPVKKLKQSSAFFTSRLIANDLTSSIRKTLAEGSSVFDPSCGAGDLLLACARHLPLHDTLKSTVAHWSQLIKGYDCHEEFVHISKLRLVLLAINRGAEVRDFSFNIASVFPGIACRDALSSEKWSETDYCILNPPFASRPIGPENEWSSGKVSQAAIFVLRALRAKPSPKKVLAILPDVLRSGTRYENWRRLVDRLASIESMESVGRFDPTTDVDVFSAVFSLPAKGNDSSKPWWTVANVPGRFQGTVGDRFKVSVGSVVPHRDPYEGPECAYLDVQVLPPWGQKRIDHQSQSRKYQGTTVSPPFVAVRRTSSPSDKERAIGTIVVGEEEVAIENHLIVLKPRTGELEDCHELLGRLHSSKTNKWLNERIRCRHLTVSSIKDLPWWSEVTG